jgi:uncharacterized membrane protein YdjX (TVP38/TMEM64 family)
LLVLLGAGVAAALYHARLLDAALVQRLAAQAGNTAPLLFIGGYALATVLFLPGSILTIAGGALFGPVAGTLYSLTGAALGATLSFLAARHLASDWVARRTGGRLAEFVRGVEAEGWRFVAFVRLVPLLPFNALNYALGLTRIPLRQYVVASYLAMLPGAAAYTYLGYAGREAFAGSDVLLRHGLVALALLAAALFLPRLAHRLRRAPASPLTDVATLKQRLANGEDLTVGRRAGRRRVHRPPRPYSGFAEYPTAGAAGAAYGAQVVEAATAGVGLPHRYAFGEGGRAAARGRLRQGRGAARRDDGMERLWLRPWSF